jgi:prolipoprotein diacylglyceryltransferase
MEPLFSSLRTSTFQIRWYSLAYIAGIFSAMFWLQKCNESRKIMSAAAYDNWLLWAILSIILGGGIGGSGGLSRCESG